MDTKTLTFALLASVAMVCLTVAVCMHAVSAETLIAAAPGFLAAGASILHAEGAHDRIDGDAAKTSSSGPAPRLPLVLLVGLGLLLASGCAGFGHAAGQVLETVGGAIQGGAAAPVIAAEVPGQYGGIAAAGAVVVGGVLASIGHALGSSSSASSFKAALDSAGDAPATKA